MATFYYGGSGSDPLVRIEVYATPTAGSFNVSVTQVQATDADAFLDTDGKYYLGDLRAFYLDFANAESFAITNFKGFAGYDATGSPIVTSPTATAYGSESVSSVGSNDTNMNGADGGKFDAGLQIGTQGIGKDDVGSITFTVGSTNTSNILTLDDFLNASFGIRVTSVGLDGNKDGDVADKGEVRTDSSKISYETAGAPDPAIVTIGNACASEGGKLDFAVTLSNASALPITLDFASTAGTASIGEFETSNFEYSTDGGATWHPAAGPSGTTVTIDAGVTSFLVRLDTGNDVYLEGPEAMHLGASVVSGSVASITSGTGTIKDSIDTTTITLGDVTIVEGANATISATVSNVVTGTSLVITLDNGATITIPVGSTTGTSTQFLAASDDVYVDAGSYNVSISSTSGGNFEALNTGDSASVVVTDDADQTTVSLSASTVDENAADTSYVFTATLSNAADGAVTVHTDHGDITIADGATTGQLVIASGQVEDVYNDASSLTATITSATGGNFEHLVIGTASATAQVNDTINSTAVTIDDVTVNSGNSATILAHVANAVTGTPLVVTLSNGATATIPVGASSANSTSFTPAASGTVSVTGTSGGNYEQLNTTDTAAVTVNSNALFFRIDVPTPEGQDRLGFDNFTITIGSSVYTMANLTVVSQTGYFAPSGTDDFSIGDGNSGAANLRTVVFRLDNAPASATNATVSFNYTSANNGNENGDGPVFSIGTTAAVGTQIATYANAAAWTGAESSSLRTIKFNYNVSGGSVLVSGVVDPIVLDLGQSGIALSNHVHFDMNGDGLAQSTAWTTGQDGILAMDLNGNGIIDSGKEIFSPDFNGGHFANALDALASLDGNGDGVIDANDAAFADLRVWVDVNSDGITDAGELMSFEQLGITSVSLATAAGGDAIDGQSVLATGSFTYVNGDSGGFAAVELEEVSDTLVLAAQGGEDVIGTDKGDVLFASDSGNLLSGGGGADMLYGSSGNDQLVGGDGNDVLVGGWGADIFTGGGGDDTFVLSAAALTDPNAVDTITDYHAGDLVDLSEVLDLGAGVDAIADGYLRVTTGGDVQVDVDGGGDQWVTLAHVNTDADHLAFQYHAGGVVQTADAMPQDIIGWI